MKYFITILIAILTAILLVFLFNGHLALKVMSGSGDITDPNLLLKVDKSDILTNKTIKKKGTDIVVYTYNSGIEIPRAKVNGIDEVVEKRTQNAQFFKKINRDGKEEWTGRFRGGSPFYEKNGRWYEARTATTTLQAWNTQTAWYERNIFALIFSKSYADIFNSDAGGDGHFQVLCTYFYECREASSGTAIGDSSVANVGVSTGFYVYRGFFPFNTSALPNNAVISAASFGIEYNSVIGVGEIGLVQTTQSDPTSLANGDYSKVGSTEGATRQTASGTGWLVFPMDSTGISWISLTGYTKLGMRIDFDIDGDEPNPIDNVVAFYTSDFQVQDAPYLDITYTAEEVTKLPKQDIIIFD